MTLKAPEICKSSQRSLGFWESLFVEMHEKLNGHNTIVAYASFTLKPEKDLANVDFVNAIKNLYQKHPILRGTIICENANYILTLNADFKNIPITIIENEPEKNWKNYLDKELNISLDLGKYLWRGILFKAIDTARYYLFLTCSHAVIDGGSAVTMLQDAIYKISQPSDESKTDSLPFYESVKVSPSDINLIPDMQINRWPFSITEYDLYHTHALIKEISTDCLAIIKPKLKKQNLSINDYIGGVYLATIQEEKPDLVKNITLFTPISLRMFMRPRISFDHVMCSAVTVDTYHDLSQNLLQEKHAVDYNRQLKNIIKHVGDGEIVNLSVTKIAEYMKDAISHRDEFIMGFGLSNLGRFDFGLDPLKGEPHSFGFCGSRRGADCPILLCVMSDAKYIRFIFNYTEPVIQN